MADQPQIIEGLEPPSEILEAIRSEEKKFWESISQESARGKVNRYLEGAKQIINLNGVLLGVYFAAIALSSISDHLTISSYWDVRWIILIISPAVCWFFGIYFAIRALEPNPYPYWVNDYQIIRSRWKEECSKLSRNVSRARWLLIIGFVFMLISLSICLYYMGDQSTEEQVISSRNGNLIVNIILRN